MGEPDRAADYQRRSAQPNQCGFRLLHLRAKPRVALPPTPDEAGVVLDRFLPLPPSLIDLRQPEMRGGGVEQIVGQRPVPGNRFVQASELGQELGAGEALVYVRVDR